MLEPYESLYIRDLGATEFMVGIVYAISTIILSIVRIPGGYIADRFGRKRIVVTMTFSVALAFLFYAFAPSWEWTLVGAIIFSICLIYQPALWAIRADSAPPQRRGTAFALMDFLPAIVAVPAPSLAIYLASTRGLVGGMRIVYLIAVGLYGSAALLRLMLKETLPKREENNAETSGSRSWEDFKRDYSDAMKFILKNLSPLLIFYAVFSFAFMGCFRFFPFFSVDVLGISSDNWGVAYMIGVALSLLAVIPSGILIDKIGRRKMLLFATGIMVSSAFVYVSTHSQTEDTLPRVFVSFPLIMLANAIFFSAFLALQADLVPRIKRGRVFAVLTLLASLTGAIGQALAGFTYQQIDPHLPVFILVSLSGVCFMITLFWIKEPTHKEL
jgi:MFS family permease